MKTEEAIARKMIRDSKGIWRLYIEKRKTWQAYHESTCIKCKKTFVSSHKKNRFCSKSCGKLGHSYTKGYKYIRTQPRKEIILRAGYYEVLDLSHPNAKIGRILEHRLVIEKKLGRILDTNEHVHHINGNKLDNRIENLVVVSRSEHMSVHAKERIMERSEESGRFVKLIGIKPHSDQFNLS